MFSRVNTETKSQLTKKLVYNFSEYYEAHFEKKMIIIILSIIK